MKSVKNCSKNLDFYIVLKYILVLEFADSVLFYFVLLLNIPPSHVCMKKHISSPDSRQDEEAEEVPLEEDSHDGQVCLFLKSNCFYWS